MEKIELVIRLPKIIYDTIMDNHKQMFIADIIYVYEAIDNGIPLPNGHGRLIDADKFISEHFGKVARIVDEAPTIIEADKEGAEE